MLEIICTASLAWSINICQSNELMTLTGTEKVKISDIFQHNTTLNRENLAEYIISESEYRREADRERERLDIRNQDNDHRDRHYRDGEQRRREIEYGEDHRDRHYRDGEQRRREIEYGEDRRDRYDRRDRSREEYIRIRKGESFQDLIQDWLSE